MKYLWVMAAASLLVMGCVPQGGARDGDPGENLEPQPDAGNQNGNNGNPRVGGEVNYPAGVGASDQVDALDADQRQAACDALEATYADVLRPADTVAFACGVQGLFAGAFDQNDPQGACETAYDACLADPGEVTQDDGDEVCPLIEQPMCTATLAEIEACISDGLEAVLLFNASFDCSLVDDLMTDEPGDMQWEASPACTAVEEKCPGLLSDDDEFAENEAAAQPI